MSLKLNNCCLSRKFELKIVLEKLDLYLLCYFSHRLIIKKRPGQKLTTIFKKEFSFILKTRYGFENCRIVESGYVRPKHMSQKIYPF